MNWRLLSSKVTAFAAISGAMVMEAMAQASGTPGVFPIYRISSPEIDGPAGIAAIALLVGAGMIAYRRYRK